MKTYSDRWIDLDDEGITVRGYYFPWGTKRIPYAGIRHVTRVTLGALNGRLRIWARATPASGCRLTQADPASGPAF